MTDTLFPVPPRLKAVDQRSVFGGKGWWAVKCLDCGKWLTKFDESKEEALGYAKDHRCDVR